MLEKETYTVCTRCFTYNHASYILDALNGFVMQETTFPVVSVIVDDASTDNEPQIILDYFNENFAVNDTSVAYQEETDYGRIFYAQHKINKNCYFAILLLKENHYSQRKSKRPYLSRWQDNAKYIALCEGDDYWTDPHKLQHNIDVLNKEPRCMMVCSRTRLFSEEEKKITGESFCKTSDGWLDPKDVIQRGGLFIATCSIVYRNGIGGYPDYAQTCHVGDYPRQIFCALTGGVYYLNHSYSVYRINNPSSFMGKYYNGNNSDELLLRRKTETMMLNGFAKDYPKYSKYFQNRIAYYVISIIPDRRRKDSTENFYFYQCYADEFKNFPLFWKVYHGFIYTKKTIIKRAFFKITRNYIRSFKELTIPVVD